MSILNCCIVLMHIQCHFNSSSFYIMLFSTLQNVKLGGDPEKKLTDHSVQGVVQNDPPLVLNDHMQLQYIFTVRTSISRLLLSTICCWKITVHFPHTKEDKSNGNFMKQLERSDPSTSLIYFMYSTFFIFNIIIIRLAFYNLSYCFPQNCCSFYTLSLFFVCLHFTGSLFPLIRSFTDISVKNFE